MSTSEDSINTRIALTVDETRASLGISRTGVYEEIAAGRLKARKVGRRTIIPTAEITRWLDNLPVKAA